MSLNPLIANYPPYAYTNGARSTNSVAPDPPHTYNLNNASGPTSWSQNAMVHCPPQTLRSPSYMATNTMKDARFYNPNGSSQQHSVLVNIIVEPPTPTLTTKSHARLASSNSSQQFPGLSFAPLAHMLQQTGSSIQQPHTPPHTPAVTMRRAPTQPRLQGSDSPNPLFYVQITPPALTPANYLAPETLNVSPGQVKNVSGHRTISSAVQAASPTYAQVSRASNANSFTSQPASLGLYHNTTTNTQGKVSAAQASALTYLGSTPGVTTPNCTPVKRARIAYESSKSPITPTIHSSVSANTTSRVTRTPATHASNHPFIIDGALDASQNLTPDNMARITSSAPNKTSPSLIHHRGPAGKPAIRMDEAKKQALRTRAHQSRDLAIASAKRDLYATARDSVVTFAQGKAAAQQDLQSTVYHAYVDSTGFAYLNITLTRVDLVRNANERVALSIYESDFAPHNYCTHMRTDGAANGNDTRTSRSDLLANGTDYATAFRAFRRAFKKHARLSWEQRLVPQDYVSSRIRQWEAQQRESLVFAKVGEQRAGGSRSPSPANEHEKGKKRSHKRKRSSESPTRLRAEDVLTKEELEACSVRAFRYMPPAEGKPRGEFPMVPRKYAAVIPGDDPEDGGFVLLLR